MKEELKFTQPITVTQPRLPDFDLYCSYIKEVWNKKWLTNNGPLHEEFKEELKQYLKVSDLELFTNGHLALELGIKSLELTGEVITTPFTFASTVHAITNCGLKPVFCDIEMDTFNINVEEIEKHITEKTSAIVAVHVFGNPCNVEKINELAKKYNLKIIYDAAHAFGVEIDGRSIASYGDLSMFSFHATKVFHSIEGGLLVFQDEELGNKLKALKNFGMPSPDRVEFIGSNAKMNEFQAAMGLCNIKTIDSDIQKRERIYEEYVNCLQNANFIKYLPQIESVKHNYSYFPIVLESNALRDRLFEQLKSYNIYARKYFYPLCNDFDCYNYDKNETPNAVHISDRILALPMFTELNINDIKKICEIILEESLLNV